MTEPDVILLGTEGIAVVKCHTLCSLIYQGGAMKKTDTERQIAYQHEYESSANNLQVQHRLRILLDLAIRIGRREGMFKSLPSPAEDTAEKRLNDGVGE
jgi:hypothetical protein